VTPICFRAASTMSELPAAAGPADAARNAASHGPVLHLFIDIPKQT
jgi:hypothetical protein